MSGSSSVVNRASFARRSINLGSDALRTVLSPLCIWRRTAWVFNVAKWKRPLLRRYFSGYNLKFLAFKDDVYAKERWIRMSRRPLFVIWGRTIPERIEEFATEFEIPIHHVEDGFMRSIGLGASHVLPYSLCYDKSGLYYDSGKPSDLESILLRYNFQYHPHVMNTARKCLESIRQLRLSKYNEARTDLASVLYGPKIRTRILVIGQVEDDQSLLHGCARIMSNAELIKLAAEENPEAQIIYKPHPDVQAGLRQEMSNTSALAHLVEILRVPLSLIDALQGVDRVYTMTSLAGFEAAIHGVPVTTLGAPFYSGWGFTDDRQLVARRDRTLTVEEVFAAAYILYPRYRDPITYRKMTLPRVIEEFKEQLESIEVVTPQKALRRLAPYNLVTRHPVDARLLYNSTAQHIALVTDSRSSWLVAQGLVQSGKRVSIIAARDTLANDESLTVSTDAADTVSVTSIHKKYSVAMSESERNAVKLASTFSDSLRLALTEVAGEHLSAEIVEALSFGLEDYIYYEALRFYGVKQSLEEYDSVAMIFDDSESNLDLIKSYIFHGQAKSMLGKIFLVSTIGGTKQILVDNATLPLAPVAKPQDISELRTTFSRFWWSLQKASYDDYSTYGPHVAICGNVSGMNYAYSPASLKIVDTVDKRSSLPMLYYSSSLLPVVGQEEVKTISLLEDLSKRCAVYNGNILSFKSKYPPEILDYSSFFSGPFFDRFQELVRQRLPEGFIDIFRGRILKYCESLFAQTIFAAEAGHAMDRAVLYATSMDRSHISRILAAVARKKKVPSIGIQPQIISKSSRYKAPAVDCMGVIDTSQVTTFVDLGADPTKLLPIGSVNISERLRTMDEAVQRFGSTPPRGSILFAMQHSTSFEMLATAQALKDICSRYGFTLIVKPHPHQEFPVLNKVRSIFGDSSFVRVLGRDSDTYDAVARSQLIVGLFSSVLFEGALYGKDVVVSAFRDLDPSIDFSRLGLAVKAHNPETLELAIVELIRGGDLARTLLESRNAYLDLNPQLKRPYDAKSVENFIASRLPKAGL